MPPILGTIILTNFSFAPYIRKVLTLLPSGKRFSSYYVHTFLCQKRQWKRVTQSGDGRSGMGEIRLKSKFAAPSPVETKASASVTFLPPTALHPLLPPSLPPYCDCFSCCLQAVSLTSWHLCSGNCMLGFCGLLLLLLSIGYMTSKQCPFLIPLCILLKVCRKWYPLYLSMFFLC